MVLVSPMLGDLQELPSDSLHGPSDLGPVVGELADNSHG